MSESNRNTANNEEADRSTFIGYIRTYDEAMLLIHAIRLKYLPLVEERLNPEEKLGIDSGHIFCFVESATGMKRWTDGRIWSPSKISGEFLIYQEVPKHLSKNSIQKMNRCNRNVNKPKLPRKNNKNVDGKTLFKQTISIQYGNLLYHIISYYRPCEIKNSLHTVEFFQKLGMALNIHNDLRNDEFVTFSVRNDPNFYEKYHLSSWSEVAQFNHHEKRALKEKKACEALIGLEDINLGDIHGENNEFNNNKLSEQ